MPFSVTWRYRISWRISVRMRQKTSSSGSSENFLCSQAGQVGAGSASPTPAPAYQAGTAKVVPQSSILCLSTSTACPTSNHHSGSFQGRGRQQRPEVSEPVAPWTFTSRPCSKEHCVHPAAEPGGRRACHLCLASSHIQNTSLP